MPRAARARRVSYHPPVSGFPFILWRHATGELWKLLVLTASILVMVISFAAAVKPLAEGRLSPVDTLKFMAFAIPPMLAYAVPFAAGFAATLTYHRLAQDNEITAAHAGGIGHRSLLAPALASGVVLAGVLMTLNESVIPRFLQSMERLITQDVTKMMIASFERGEALRLGDLMVYADGVTRLDPESEESVRHLGATEWLLLTGVVFAELNGHGSVTEEAAVQSASLWLIPREGPDGQRETIAQVRTGPGAAYRSGERAFVTFEHLTPKPIVTPNAFEDDPKFLTGSELANLLRRPDRMSFVRSRSRELALHMAIREIATDVERSLAEQRRVRLDRSGDEWLVVRASGIEWDGPRVMWRLAPSEPDGAVLVERWRKRVDGSAFLTELRAERAWLDAAFVVTQDERDLKLALELEEIESRDMDDTEPSGHRTAMKFDNITPANDPLPVYLGMGANELLAEAQPRIEGAGADRFLIGPTHELRKRIERLEREVLSKRHERWAMAIAGLVMVLTGAVTAMRLRDALPLTVYLWSFFPALGALISISAGQQVVHDHGASGLLVLWGGVFGLALYTLVAFIGLSKR